MSPPPKCPPTLPPPPTGCVRFGWYGLALALPDTWNLSFHVGGMRAGTLVFSDLHGPKLEVRWKSPPWMLGRFLTPKRMLRRTVGRLRRRNQVFETAPGAFRMEREGRFWALTTTEAPAARFVELACPGDGEVLSSILEDFRRCDALLRESDWWFWSVYGIRGRLPRKARLTDAEFLPGQSRLFFSWPGGRMNLGACSLADRWLNGASDAAALRNWASGSHPFIRDHPGGIWKESGQSVSYSCRGTRLLPFPARVLHQTVIEHDADANLIRWTHRTERAKKDNLHG